MTALRTRPRLSEKREQQHIVQALRAVGATVYVLGTVHRGEPGSMTTRQTPGLPDLCVHLPDAPKGRVPDMDRWVAGVELSPCAAHQLWIEVKAQGGRLRPAQAGFRDFCRLAGVPHLVGGLDVVLAYLQQQGYLREIAHYRQAVAP